MGLHRKFRADCPSGRRGFNGDRRRAPRYRIGGAPAILAWPEDGGYRKVSMRLRDISLGGASGLADECPPRDSRVWICLRDGAPDEWIEATVLRTMSTRYFFPGPLLVHLRFSEVCPYDAFKAVVELARTVERAPALALDSRG